MCESFVSEFLVKLDKHFNPSDIRMIRKMLLMHLNDYEITVRQTNLACSDHLKKYMQMYLVTRKIEGLADGSLKLYSNYLSDFVQKTHKNPIDITPNDVRLYLYSVQKERGIQNRTLESRRVVVTGFLRWLYDEGHTKVNAARGIKPIRCQERVKEAISAIDMEKIRCACKSNRDRAIVETLYSSGCRVTELTKLKRDDISMENREIKIHGKGGRERVSYLNAKAEHALREYWNSRTDDNPYAFVSVIRPYHNVTKECIENVVRNVGKRAGLNRRIHPHLIRHTVATDALSRGMSIAEIQRFLGHKSIDTTLIYAKVCDDDIKNNHKKFI